MKLTEKQIEEYFSCHVVSSADDLKTKEIDRLIISLGKKIAETIEDEYKLKLMFF